MNKKLKLLYFLYLRRIGGSLMVIVCICRLQRVCGILEVRTPWLAEGNWGFGLTGWVSSGRSLGYIKRPGYLQELVFSGGPGDLDNFQGLAAIGDLIALRFQ